MAFKEPLTIDCCFNPEDTIKFHFYSPDHLDITIRYNGEYHDVLLTPDDTWAIVRYLMTALLDAKELP